MKIKQNLVLVLTLFLTLLFYSAALAQSEQLTLGFSRDFGYASGAGDIQGVFSISTKGPESLVKVDFYIDQDLLGTDAEAPFKLQFSTDNHPLGAHDLYAIGYTSDGRELRSKTYARNFVSAEQGWKVAAGIAGPILGLTLGITILAGVIPLLASRSRREHLPPGTPRKYGLKGGTICPKCSRPFSVHLFSLNLSFVGKLDFCPHCGKWSVVRRYSLDELRRAEQAELEETGEIGKINGLSAEEKLRKELDESRYQGL